MLPDFLARHVILAAKVDSALVVEVDAFERGGVGAAMVEAALDTPGGIRTPSRVGNDNLVPVSEERVGKNQLAPAGLVDDLLLALL